MLGALETLARQECSIRNSQNPGCQGNQLFSAEAPSGQPSLGARGPQGSAALQWREGPRALRTCELLVHSMCTLLVLGQTGTEAQKLGGICWGLCNKLGAAPGPEPGPPGPQYFQALGEATPLEPDCQERDPLPHLPNLAHLRDGPCHSQHWSGRPSEKCSSCLSGVIPDLRASNRGWEHTLPPTLLD